MHRNLCIQVQKANLGLLGSLAELRYCSARQACQFQHGPACRYSIFGSFAV